MLLGPWRIEMFGRLRVVGSDRTIDRFRTEKTAVLLAYLAYHLDRSHSREELIELLWPEADTARGQMSLRTAIASLRRQLEPPGTRAGTVIFSDKKSLRLNSASAITDVGEFTRLLNEAVTDDDTANDKLAQAAAIYRGELLAGMYDEWVVTARNALREELFEALYKAIRARAEKKEFECAAKLGRLAVGIDPVREESHRALMRLYAAAGRPSAALEQYQQLKSVLREALDQEPSRASRELAEALNETTRSAAGVRTHTPPAASVDPPPPLSPEPIPVRHERASLPLSLTSFIGRKSELDSLIKLLTPNGVTSPRLVTLLGPGGIGKTRTAIETANNLAEQFRGRVWFVPLANAFDVDQVVSAITATLRIRRTSSSAPIDQIAARLGEQPALMVLDNFEQVTEPGSTVVSELMAKSRSLRALVTSRRRLSIPGERLFPITPLEVPLDELDAASLLEVPSVQLFVDRARDAKPDFQLTEGNRGSVAQLCSMLEGMPLALELAAARAQVLTPAKMVEQVRDRLGFLVSRRRDVEERHRSLRAAIDWSYGLLTPDLQRLLARLSVFRGGWTLEAAQAVCYPPELQPDLNRVIDDMADLTDNSLIISDETGAEMRFRMQESLREFAEDCVPTYDVESLRSRHAQHILKIALEASLNLTGPDQKAWLDRLDLENSNLRAALSWLKSHQPEEGLRLAAVIWRFWYGRSYFREGYHWLTDLLEESPPDDTQVGELVRARALNGAGVLALQQSEFATAEERFKACLPTFRELGERAAESDCLNNLGNTAFDRGDFQLARSLYEEALEIKREIADRHGMARVLNNLGMALYHAQEIAASRLIQEESLEINRELGDWRLVASALNSLANVMSAQGDLTAARRHYEESLSIRRDLGDRVNLGLVLNNLAALSRTEGDYDKALALNREALLTIEDLGDRRTIASVLEGTANSTAALGRLESAARIWAIAERLEGEIGGRYERFEEYSVKRDQTRAALGDAVFEQVSREARRMSLEEAIDFVLERA